MSVFVFLDQRLNVSPILFLLRDNQLVALGLAEEKATYKEVSFDHSILLKPTWDFFICSFFFSKS
jgi:hypothetical protein